MAQQPQPLATPQPPVFGLAGGDAQNNKNISIDDIFADCFMDTDLELMGLAGGGMNDSSNAVADAATANMSGQMQGASGAMPLMNYAPLSMPSQGVGQQQAMPQQPMQPMPNSAPQQQQQQQGAGSDSGDGGRPNRANNAAKRVAASSAAASARSMANAAAGQSTDEDVKDRKKKPRSSGRNMSEQQKLERRERNREHAKRSRVRKKFLLESLQKSVSALQDENDKLRTAIKENCDDAKELLAKSETGSLLATTPGEATRVLDDADYSLVKALQTAQQNFVITDPTLPDNPIIMASDGFLQLTGYSLEQVLGRNCRFLQGPDTDPKAVEKIRKAIETGCDTSVCLLNYTAAGEKFFNQFFIAALRDAQGRIVNFVGVQCKVSEEFVQAVQKQEENDDADESDNEDQDFDM